jgi:hypothetical protein
MKDFKILDKNVKKEDIEWLYGGEEFKITNKQIKELLNGNKLYATINDEYAFTINLECETSNATTNKNL